MVSDVADTVLELTPGGYDLFPGSYEEFLEKTGRTTDAVGSR
jgi:hypothetical protein